MICLTQFVTKKKQKGIWRLCSCWGGQLTTKKPDLKRENEQINELTRNVLRIDEESMAVTEGKKGKLYNVQGVKVHASGGGRPEEV